MVQFTVGAGSSVDFSELDLISLLDGEIISRSSTQLVLGLDSGELETFTGVDFIYDSDGDPLGGTITGIRETLNGQTVFEMTGLNVSIAQFVDWVLRDANAEAYLGLFSGNDNVVGSAEDDVLGGGAGHDNLFGGAGSDDLEGGDGNDHLYGQSANGGADEGDLIFGEAGSDYIQGNAGNDSLDGGIGSDRIQGGRDEDSIRGGEGNDTINGNLGNDSVEGGTGNDSIRGGQGNDQLNGGDGNDTLSGDLGADTLTGGALADVFLFTGAGSPVSAFDRITDFTDGVDHLSVGYAPLAVLAGGSLNSFSAAAAQAQSLFDGHAGNGEVASIAVGSDTYVFFSSNGGSVADSAVLLAGYPLASTITLDDFI
ncbi:hypothetical protein ASE00_04315 [Sphingomonas sp. Root710]|uniref:calcium-binding protein n=1 Tax=Sphingomonas sp. Root710 TaxID=1736594 RepID=UPI0006F6F336|nr:calcium-binding protein [Sphingomonas sp. Root710]KRB85978.1 hypothetical protein ASE00_04315 [Sphingomonas sp. Root710]